MRVSFNVFLRYLHTRLHGYKNYVINSGKKLSIFTLTSIHLNQTHSKTHMATFNTIIILVTFNNSFGKSCRVLENSINNMVETMNEVVNHSEIEFKAPNTIGDKIFATQQVSEFNEGELLEKSVGDDGRAVRLHHHTPKYLGREELPGKTIFRQEASKRVHVPVVDQRRPSGGFGKSGERKTQHSIPYQIESRDREEKLEQIKREEKQKLEWYTELML